jgi:hypothetical protein
MSQLVQGLFDVLFWLAFVLIFSVVIYELIAPKNVTDGFQNLVNIGDSKFWTKLVPRRGDVGPEQEQDGLIRDSRYFSDYVDVQRFGVNTDFCRFVQKGTDEQDKFLACALGGTENLSSTGFRGPSVREGFILGRDDYMRDVDGDGRYDYCRIIKQSSGGFQSECNFATETGFSPNMSLDSDPPPDVVILLKMYQDCVFWLRFRDDMLDYVQNMVLNIAGGASVKENPPKPDTTEALTLNGETQYLRVGDDPYLNLGSVIQLRSIRAFHFWVRFDEFTNNAHVFDFGNGAGIDNVWAGILNRGNQVTDAEVGAKKGASCGEESVVPDSPSGAQRDPEVTPQELMKTTAANVEEFSCEGFAVAPKVKPRKKVGSVSNLLAKTADMCYEIWDKDQRKMRVIVPQMFQLGAWTHVVITAEGTDSFRPDIAFYKNGVKLQTQPSGWLPQRSITEKNYIGKSNWANVTSQYANKDELLKGAVFDFRGYVSPLNSSVIKDSYEWGSKMLGLKQ